MALQLKKFFRLLPFCIPVSFLSCVTQHHVNNPPSAVVLYASDTPNKTLPFSQKLFSDINHSKIFATDNRPFLAEDWVENFVEAEVLTQSNELKKLTLNVQNAYQELPLDQAKVKAQNAMSDAQQILLKSHSNLSAEYAELAFWVAVVNFDEPIKMAFPAGIFHSLADKKLIAHLQEQVSPKIVSLIEKNAQPIHLLNVKTKDKCTFYSNGSPQTSSPVLVIAGGMNTLTAHCPTGDASRYFNSEKVKNINLELISGVAERSPAPIYAPFHSINETGVDSALFVYYSSKENYIDVDVYNNHTKEFNGSYRVMLKTKQDRKNSEQALVHYFKDASLKIQGLPTEKPATHDVKKVATKKTHRA